MNDSFNRNIDYLRISLTDRCNLKCVYCIPSCTVKNTEKNEILKSDEIIRLCGIFAKIGIKNIKLTGGEPLVRTSLPRIIYEVKSIPGIEKVTLTTNGTALEDKLDDLVSAGLDGVNISIDALNEEVYRQITGFYGADKVIRGINKALTFKDLNVKLNCVPFDKNTTELVPIALLAKDSKLCVRFIELMPIGAGTDFKGKSEDEIKALLESNFGKLLPYDEKLGNGPCRYYSVPDFTGKIGFISAVSHKFCKDCNRIRLTSSGFLKTCLQFDSGINLREMLDKDDDYILAAIENAVLKKPECHMFGLKNISNRETKIMSQIGG